MPNTTNVTTVPIHADPLTEEEFKKALPPQFRKAISKELINKINTTISDPEMYEDFRNSLLSYTLVLKEGKFKIDQYIDAIKYVGYKVAGATNMDAYMRAFPERMARHASRGASAESIAAYVSAYNKSKLVNLIYEQTLVPSWILNQDLYQKALNTQAELMMYARSEKVRSDAANSILTHLKRPESQKVELEIATPENSTIDLLRQATLELVNQQKMMITAGQSTAKEIAESNIEYVDVEAGSLNQ